MSLTFTYWLKICSGRREWLLYNVLIFLALTRICLGTREMKRAASDFSRHSIVQPILRHGQTKREISSTKVSTGGHHSEVQVTVPIDGEQWVLELRLNEELVAGGHTLQYQQGGETVHHKPKKEELDLCHYSGRVRGKPQSWVAVSTCRGVTGVIFDGQRMRYIEPAQGSEIQPLHYLYDHKDLITESQKARGHHRQPETMHSTRIGDVTNITDDSESRRPRIRRSYEKIEQHCASSRSKRESDSQPREQYNANQTSRYVELVLVADHAEFRANGRNVWAVQKRLTQMANIINSMFTSLNVYIALVGVVVWSERDKISISDDGDETLFNFLNYKKKLAIEIPHDNAFLITLQKFYGGIVGKSLPSSMCKSYCSGGVAVNFTRVIGLGAATVAHEIGHNFGMDHDESCEMMRCPDGQCIMSEWSTSFIPVHWSSCSVKALEKSFEEGLDYCLHNKPKRLFKSPTCGNGFIEAGEQCDCGTTIGGGANPCHACCQPDTCMLRETATCGAGACCDFTTCRPKSAGAVCRSAERECDLPEYCTGHSEYCPADVHKMDSTPCGQGEDQAFCMRGSCSSHSAQCRLLWGAKGSSHHNCYYFKNTNGTKQGNCGYDPASQIYKPCAPRDVLCGLLQCSTEEFRLEHAMANEEGVETEVSSYVQDRVRYDCYTANFKLEGNHVDLGLVPDGAKCGHERMCLKQRCESVEAVREEIAKQVSSVCPSNCSGHGVCNSEGHCHCDAGFAPPLCAVNDSRDSVDFGLATKLGKDSVYRGVLYMELNTRTSSNSVYPTLNINLNSAPVYPRHNTKLRSSVYFRPFIRPSRGSSYSTPNTKSNSGSVYSIHNTKPNSGSVYSKQNTKPNSGSVYSKQNTKPNSGSVYSIQNTKPNSGSVYSIQNTKPNSGYVYSIQNTKPNSGSVYPRPNTNLRSGSVYSTPNMNLNSRSVYPRPYTKPRSSSDFSRPYIRPSFGSTYSIPNTEPRSGSVYPRPYTKPRSGSVRPRPYTKPRSGSVYPRAYTKPSSGSVYPRPYTKPRSGSVYPRPYTKPRSGSVYPRPYTKPSSGSVYPRPYTKPRSGSVYPRPYTKPRSGSVYPRPYTKLKLYTERILNPRLNKVEQ